MSQLNVTNVVNPYLADVGVGLVFGLGYYLIKYIYGDKEKDGKDNKLNSDLKSEINLESCKTVEDYNHLIKLNEENPKLNPLEIINRINKSHLTPDVTTYNNLLNSCFCTLNFDNAEKLVEEIFDFGSPIQPDLSTFNILLKGISVKLDSADHSNNDEEKKKQISKLDKIFDQIKKFGESNQNVKPNDITINTSLDILIKAGEIERAWDLFEHMKSDFNINPDKYSYSTIIKALKYDPNPEKLEKAFGIIEFLKQQSHSVSNDEIIFNCLIDVCIKIGQMEKAEKVFKEMKLIGVEASKVTYAIMIKGYGQVYNLEKAFSMFEEMKLSNMPPNEIIYGCLLNACVRCSNIERVTEIYKEMKQHCLDMNIILYTTLIKAYTKVKDLRSALDVYYTMLNDPKVNPNIVIHNAVLDCCVECGDTKKMNDIYQLIREKAVNSCNDDNVPQPDLITYSTVIKGYAKARDMSKVFDIYKFLKQNSEQFKLDEVIYNSILDGCAKTNNLNKGLEIYEEMINLNINRSNVTYSILIKIYANSGKDDKALSLLEEMEKKGIVPGVIVYTCLIQTCLKTKKFQQAINLFEKMKTNGAKADHVLYNTVINGCLYNQMWTLACKYTIESFEKNVKIANDIYNTVLHKLTAHYCNIKQFQKVEYASTIIKEMKERGLEIPEEIFSKVAKLIYQVNGTKVEFETPKSSSNNFNNTNSYNNKGNNYNNRYYNNKEYYNKKSNYEEKDFYSSNSNRKDLTKDDLKYQRKNYSSVNN